MSLYADYLRERTDDRIIEVDDGFATYRFLGDRNAVYIIDIYVVPEKRQTGVAKDMADKIANEARAKGCVEMLGSVAPSTKGSTRSLDVLRAYGMTLQSASADFIIMRKDI